ncbi:hypothetical protein F6R98_21035 [Candidatus Methylospira mobilis]|uniref:Uncharacterized protein n=1 Tax=Candidatus Methylospira mobilis TaxID=1808979 RepID=A0A5Q0BRW3_9GAMM|nr:hypothetical protein [Candidatus Methylospira mobilis]QFY44807.1 hypothetical protein F6R98_21035 [Candidatus Methylospira mobilis]WNV05649.1 hypothetical protein RP726_04315 [Candidatus Methylospira mobilis]
MNHALKKLNDELSAARATLTQALVAGEDTTEARAAIARIESEIALLERQSRESAESSRLAAESVIESMALELAHQTHDAIAAAAELPGLTEIAGEPLPELPKNPEIARAAFAVARASAALERAEADFKPHAAGVSALRERQADNCLLSNQLSSGV